MPEFIQRYIDQGDLNDIENFASTVLAEESDFGEDLEEEAARDKSFRLSPEPESSEQRGIDDDETLPDSDLPSSPPPRGPRPRKSLPRAFRHDSDDMPPNPQSSRVPATQESARSTARKAPRKTVSQSSTTKKHATRKGARESAKKATGAALKKKRRAKPVGIKSTQRKSRKFKAGTVALKEIKKYQGSGADGYRLLIPLLPFQRLVKEIALNAAGGGVHLRWQASAIAALQEAAEGYLVLEFELANLFAIHARRVTVFNKDMLLVQKVRRMLGA